MSFEEQYPADECAGCREYEQERVHLTARLAEAEARVVPVHVIFDGPPSHESGRFVEVETPDGKSIRLGQWLNRGDGYWALVFNVSIDQTAGYEVAKEG